LKDLLSGGGSKTKSSTRAGAPTAVAGLTDTLDMFQASKCSSPSTTSSNRRPVDVTQNLLATLESINTDFNENNNRSASTTGTTRNTTSTTSVNDQTNTFDRDALDSLSELNRLLRVKATLRRAASMGGSGSTRTSGVPQTTTMF
jgi:hypothetical protein